MAIEIEYTSNKTGATEKTRGSDGRTDTSSRIDGRPYYASRDTGLAFPIVFTFNDAESVEYALYLKNISSDKEMIIASADVGSTLAARFLFEWVTGTAAGGTAIAIKNSNQSRPTEFSNYGEAMEGLAAGTGITGLTSDGFIGRGWCVPTGEVELRFKEIVRIPQGKAVALQVLEVAAASDVGGTFYVYFE